MLQPEEIKNITFEQSVFSGYKKEEVDEFLDKVYSEYSRIFKENAELVEKLKVCITKIEEYRQDEKFLKSAIVNAQKLNETAMQEISVKKKETEEIARKQAEEIVSHAKAEAERLLTDANQKIGAFREKTTMEFAQKQLENAQTFDEQMKRYEAQIAAKEAELAHMQKEVDDFRTTVLSIYQKQVELFSTIPEFEVPTTEKIDPVVPAVVEEKATEPIEEKIELAEETAEPVIEETIIDEPQIEPATEEKADEIVSAQEEEVLEEQTSEIVPEDDEQISIDEMIATKVSPVEPQSPVITPITDEEEVEEEEQFHLFGTSPLVFPNDIPEDEDDIVHTPAKRGPRSKKKLKFGVDFDVKKDK